MGSIAAVTRRFFGSETRRAGAAVDVDRRRVRRDVGQQERQRHASSRTKQESVGRRAASPPDKQAEVQLLLQQRDPSTLQCYQDVLDEKHDRAFKGTVIVLLELTPAGKATAKVIGGTLNNKEVTTAWSRS